MKPPFDDVRIDLPCECGKVVQKSVGWIKSHSHENFACPCGRVLRLDGSDVKRKLAEANRSWARVGRK